jgi:hypothetical protein
VWRALALGLNDGEEPSLTHGPVVILEGRNEWLDGTSITQLPQYLGCALAHGPVVILEGYDEWLDGMQLPQCLDCSLRLFAKFEARV